VPRALPMQSSPAGFDIMDDQNTDRQFSRVALPAVVLGIGLCAAYIATYRPGYLSNAYYLGGLIFLQILAAAVWNYRKRFFLLLVVVFFWAGTGLPFSRVWTAGRWWVLTVGAIAGFALYMRDQQRHRFGTFHLMALFCALAALISASVSALPVVSSLKALSLLLLFLYGSTGARLALAGREEEFFRRLLSAVEILVYVSAVVYLIFRIPVYGNPNSMGAIMGVIAVPLLFWGALIAEGKTERRRAIFAFTVSAVLLFFSQARAGILAAGIACLLTCIALRRYRLVVQGGLACIAIAFLAVMLTPAESLEDMPSRRGGASTLSIFLYKGNENSGLLGSRGSIWDETVSVIQANPWFGSGFGTSVATPGQDDTAFGQYSSSSGTTKEHGDSYLAILEGVGLLGVLPFFAIVLMLGLRVKGVFVRLRRTSNLRHCSVPVAMIMAAGLVHAGFEDWLFAVGYYLCVFFWVLAFAFIDILPADVVRAGHSITDFGFRTISRGTTVVASQR
jgi:O-antigen ligase